MLYATLELGLIVILTSIPVLASTFEEAWTRVKKERSKTSSRSVSVPTPIPELDMSMLELGPFRPNGRTSYEGRNGDEQGVHKMAVVTIQSGDKDTLTAASASDHFLEWSRLGFGASNQRSEMSE